MASLESENTITLYEWNQYDVSYNRLKYLISYHMQNTHYNKIKFRYLPNFFSSI